MQCSLKYIRDPVQERQVGVELHEAQPENSVAQSLHTPLTLYGKEAGQALEHTLFRRTNGAEQLVQLVDKEEHVTQLAAHV